MLPPPPGDLSYFQRDEMGAIADQQYADGPSIVVFIGQEGSGKSSWALWYQANARQRYRDLLDRRRVLTVADAKARLGACGLLKTRADHFWLTAEWKIRFGSRRANEGEITNLAIRRAKEVGLEIPLKGKEMIKNTLPTPVVHIITPSMISNPGELVRATARRVLGRLHSHESRWDTRQRLMDELSDSTNGHFLIFDQGERCNLPTLKMVEEIFEDGKVSILLLGTEILESNLRQQGATSLYSRIFMLYNVESLNLSQTRAYLVGWGDGLVRRIFESTAGNFRRIAHLTDMALQIAEAEGESTITDEIFAQALRMVPNLIPASGSLRRSLGKKVAAPAKAQEPRASSTVTLQQQEVKRASG